jgi:hypothetical protein
MLPFVKLLGFEGGVEAKGLWRQGHAFHWTREGTSMLGHLVFVPLIARVGGGYGYQRIGSFPDLDSPHMPGFGMFIVMAVVVLGVVGALLRRRGSQGGMGPALILRKFKIDELAEDGILLEITGRKPGIVAWLLTAIGLGAETSLVLTTTEISFTTSSLYGRIHRLVPLPNISSTDCSFYKPFGMLVLAVIFSTTGLLMAANDQKVGLIIGLILAAICAAIYWRSKSLVIALETKGGRRDLGLRFKPSVLSGIPVDIRKAIQAIQMINRKAVEAQGLAIV